MELHDPIELIQRNLDEWETPYVELDIFGTGDAQRIVKTVDAFCRAHLGSRLAGYLFHKTSVGSTHGVRLEDGRDVVVKARPPAGKNQYLKQDIERLETICEVMRWLHERAYPCPKLLLGPMSLGNGFATVEEYFEHGERGDVFQAGCRRTIAAGLAELVKLLRMCDIDAARLRPSKSGDALYPQPHGKIFNFETTNAGAEWIDDFARRARRLEMHAGIRMLGHADWRVEHLRIEGDRIAGVYDWDSLAFLPETELIGISAHGFTADWSLPNVRRIPSREDIRAYIDDYEHARGRPFSRPERQSVIATCVYWISYGARCMHSLEPLKTEWEKDTYPYLLLTEGKALLAEAGL